MKTIKAGMLPLSLATMQDIVRELIERDLHFVVCWAGRDGADFECSSEDYAHFVGQYLAECAETEEE